MIGPEELHELLHADAATVEPVPHLAELGTALTGVERHRRARFAVGTSIVFVAVAAAVIVVRTIETRPTRFDTAPATQRVVMLPDAPVVTTSTVPTTGDPASTVPASTAATNAGAAGIAAPPAGNPTVTTAPRPAATAPDRTSSGRVLTFRAASVSDLSSADPPAVDYFGVAPPGTIVTATSAYGTASTQSGLDTQWSLHLELPNAPVGQRIKVVLSAPPLPSLTFNFTHTAG